MKYEEDGSTKRSIENVKKILIERGVPDEIRMWYGTKNWFQVQAIWKKPAYQHLFHGFSWGYTGEGPHGLLFLLKAVGADVTIENIGSWPAEPDDAAKGEDPQDWSPRKPTYRIFEKTVDYGKDWI